jgi:hypothetical protein
MLLAAEFERLSASNAALANFASRIYIALGDYDHGLELMNRAIDAEAMPIFYKDQPLWNPIRRDPRFQDILRRLRVPLDQR